MVFATISEKMQIGYFLLTVALFGVIAFLLITSGIIVSWPLLMRLADRIILAYHARSRLKKKGLTRAIRKKIFKRLRSIRKIHRLRLKKESRAKRMENHKGPGPP